MIFTDGLYTLNAEGEIVPYVPTIDLSNYYTKDQVDAKESEILQTVQSYIDSKIVEFSSTQWAALSAEQKASYKLAVVYQG